MKKLILTSMLTAVGLLAQSSTTAPAQPKSSTTPAPATQTPAKATHKHKKNSKPPATPAVKNGQNAPAQNGASKTPATPAPAGK